MTAAKRLLEAVRDRVMVSATSPFAHAPYPLAATLEHRGDSGLMGPGSVSWPVIGDVAAFVGGIRGLLIQAAHPEVAAGVGDHSLYRDDPMGRLSRTSSYVTATTYGAVPEVEAAVRRVQRAHRVVTGTSSRGVGYDAADPVLSAWVHNALTDSFLTAHVTYGGIALTADDQNRFVREQNRVGALLGADPMPLTRRGLATWIGSHPDIARSPEMEDAVTFLTDPPLAGGLRIGYRILFEAAVATIPARLLNALGLVPKPGAIAVGRSFVSTLRWAIGYSPSWKLALERCGAPIPDGLFRHEARVA
ncbi:MAG: oxygenase MpaB family protein [Acidimicrobiia bacterium]|nr:oxygenase MpaB family protein [Acidimicrobiia bacterium]